MRKAGCLEAGLGWANPGQAWLFHKAQLGGSSRARPADRHSSQSRTALARDGPPAHPCARPGLSPAARHDVLNCK